VKIFDVWNYNGEPVADARVEYLTEHVDHFVIVEGLHTFTGQRKDRFFFETASFRSNPKVIFVPVFDVVPGGVWANEAHQRNAALRILRVLADDDDLCFCADADELPRVEDFDQMARVADSLGGATLVTQDFYYYNLNWRKPTAWPNAFAARAKTFQHYDIQELRGRIRGGIHSGWHISYAENIENIRRKIASFSHTECDRPEFQTEEHLQACLETGRDLFNRGPGEDCLPDEPQLPPALQAFNARIRAAQGLK
jgi:beta-1,4-mannosyl-glycoprotein beta-1,4-N-acetylglucosaminyltransferase